ncbi:DUF1289 domain-containing protein [Paraburkholderia sp. UYCP14C]|uniref:DUF1289 domain-containing protein n=1 Tax=Paraburkholderia sp. UYCP14C TaxID=2511130 RepID=UPI00101FFB13|nr:DUF1289 domain-containing protein [Paraburkholderia sp. UYCP14C]RZF27945.1 DUF1289 domain-containing protein [Paraburkholderia sp. UYCP14C]
MAVNSPCIDVCTLDGKTGFCVGCLRTREEIREWKKMTDHRRHQVLNDRSRRQAKLKRESSISNVDTCASSEEPRCD